MKKETSKKADEKPFAKTSQKIDRNIIKITAAEVRALNKVAKNEDSKSIESSDAFYLILDNKYIDLVDNKYVLTELGKKARSSQVT